MMMVMMKVMIPNGVDDDDGDGDDDVADVGEVVMKVGILMMNLKRKSF